MKKLFSNFLAHVDRSLFHVFIPVYHNKSKADSTLVGKILTVLLIISTIFYILPQFNQLVNETKPTISTFPEFSPIGFPTFVNNKNFTFAAGVKMGDTLMNASNSYFTINFYSYLLNSQVETNLGLRVCKVSNNGIIIENFFCPEDYDVTMMFQSDSDFPSIALEVTISLCENSSVITCSPDASDINQMIEDSNIALIFAITENYFNGEDSDPLADTIYFQSVLLNNGPIDMQFSFTLDNIMVNTQSGIFMPSTTTEYGVQINKDLSGLVYQYTTYKVYYLSATIMPSTNLYVYNREYMNIETFLIKFGGLKHIIATIFAFLAGILITNSAKLRVADRFLNFHEFDQKRKRTDSIASNKSSDEKFYEGRSRISTYFYQKRAIENHSKKFVEDFLDVINIAKNHGVVKILETILFTEKDQIAIKYTEKIKVEDSDVVLSKNSLKTLNLEVSSSGISEHLKKTPARFSSKLHSINQNINIEKIEKFIDLYKNYVKLKGRNSEMDNKILRLLNQDTHAKLANMQEKLSSSCEREEIEDFIIQNIVEFSSIYSST